MPPPAGQRILIFAGHPQSAEELRGQLQEAGYAVNVRPVEDTVPEDAAGHHLVAREGTRSSSQALAVCRRLRLQLSDGFTPLRYVISAPSPAAPLACLEGCAGSYLRPP